MQLYGKEIDKIFHDYFVFKVSVKIYSQRSGFSGVGKRSLPSRRTTLK